jgi:phosphoserine phosphatase
MLGSLDLPLAIPEFLRSLQESGARPFLERLAGPPGLAAFDADGTIWEGDIGEEVLEELIREGRLLSPPPDPWGEYVQLVKRDPAAGFAFTGRVMQGLPESLLRELSARVYARTIAPQIFPAMRWLIEELRRRGWEIYVVSASNRWSIEVAVEPLGISATHVLALDVEAEGGKLTDHVRRPIPTLEGKPALLRNAAGRAPDLAFGNSVLDLPLLLTAAVPVAVGSVGEAPRNRFLAQAMRRGWARLEFPATT